MEESFASFMRSFTLLFSSFHGSQISRLFQDCVHFFNLLRVDIFCQKHLKKSRCHQSLSESILFKLPLNLKKDLRGLKDTAPRKKFPIRKNRQNILPNATFAPIKRSSRLFKMAYLKLIYHLMCRIGGRNNLASTMKL